MNPSTGIRWPQSSTLEPSPIFTVWPEVGHRDLATSVSCECRIDWQDPSTIEEHIKSNDLTGCKNASSNQQSVRLRDMSTVVGTLATKFNNLDEGTTFASLAWEEMYDRHWAGTAEVRFPGRSLISTQLINLGRTLRKKEIYRKGRATVESKQVLPDETIPEWIDTSDLAEALRKKITPLQHSVLRMKFVDNLSITEIAKRRDSGAPNIANTLKDAFRRLKESIGNLTQDDPSLADKAEDLIRRLLSDPEPSNA